MDKIHNDIFKRVNERRHQKQSTRVREKSALIGIVKDIRSIGIKCDYLHLLNDGQIQRLINLWKNKGNKNRTIYVKLYLLKKYFSLKVIHIVRANKLVTKVDYNVVKTVWPWVSSDKIDDPLVKMVATAQQLFGLKYREVISLRASMLLYGNVRVLSQYAFNEKERFIPIENDAQKHWIVEFKDKWEQRLEELPSERLIWIVKKHYQHIKLPDLEYFRYQYAKTRYQSLYDSITKCGARKLAMRQLRLELGFSHNGYVKRMLLCLKEG